MTFTDHELHLIACALLVACEVYGKDAETCASAPQLARAFQIQQRECAIIAERINKEAP